MLLVFEILDKIESHFYFLCALSMSTKLVTPSKAFFFAGGYGEVGSIRGLSIENERSFSSVYLGEIMGLTKLFCIYLGISFRHSS